MIPKRKKYKRHPRPKNWRDLEKWTWLRGYNKYYKISNMGRILRIARPGSRGLRRKTVRRHIVTPFLDYGWIVYVKLETPDGRKIKKCLKNLVGKHWLRPYYGGQIVLKDPMDVFDCSVYNLKEVGITKYYKNQKLTEEESLCLQRRYWDICMSVIVTGKHVHRVF